MTAYYTAAQNRSYYTDSSVAYGARARELIVEALDDLVRQGFDFGRLSSDSDGYVYALNAFYAGPIVNNWAEGLWPHSSSLGSPYQAADGKRLFDYQITNMGDELTLGTFCHENGHMLCDFPDLYDYGYESFGAGYFCLMAYGGNGTNPVQVCAYLKNEAGWASSLTAITSGMTATIAAGQNDFYIYSNNDSEYFIIENRQQMGRDAYLADAGLAIWHVDERGSNNNEQMNATSHYECSLVQADNRWDLEHNANAGDSEDLFSAPFSTRFSDDTMPSSRWWDGGASGLAISNVSASGATMTFSTSAITALFRYWNGAASDHFYTTDWNELGSGNYGWVYEGTQCYVSVVQEAGTVPLYRYWNGEAGDHFYTTDWNELGSGNYGWVYEGVQCYVYPGAAAGTVPLYRYWNADAADHFYTTNWNELGSGNYGWMFEGVQCQVFARPPRTASIQTPVSVRTEEACMVQAIPQGSFAYEATRNTRSMELFVGRAKTQASGAVPATFRGVPRGQESGIHTGAPQPQTFTYTPKLSVTGGNVDVRGNVSLSGDLLLKEFEIRSFTRNGQNVLSLERNGLATLLEATYGPENPFFGAPVSVDVRASLQAGEVSTRVINADWHKIGRKWSLSYASGGGDDDWLRLMNWSGHSFLGGFAAEKLWSSTGHLTGSDCRMKDAIAPIGESLEKITNLRGVSYNWTKDGGAGKKHIGLVAQDVEKVVPEVVEDGPDGMKGLEYSGLVALLIEGMKELHGMVCAQSNASRAQQEPVEGS